jgi:hypothetical protein
MYWLLNSKKGRCTLREHTHGYWLLVFNYLRFERLTFSLLIYFSASAQAAERCVRLRAIFVQESFRRILLCQRGTKLAAKVNL